MPIEGLHDDVRAGVYAAQVRGIVRYFSNHLKLLTTYGAIADALQGTPRGCSIADALALIAEEDHAAGMPITTAVVVNHETGMPGTGFFTQMRRLGVASGGDEKAQRHFWESQLRFMGVAPLTLEQSRDHTVQASYQDGAAKVVTRTFVTPTHGVGAPKESVADDLKRQTTTNPQSGEVHFPVHRLQPGMVVIVNRQERHASRRMVTNVPEQFEVLSVREEESTDSSIPSILIWTARRANEQEAPERTFRSPFGTHIKIVGQSVPSEPHSMLPGDEPCEMAVEMASILNPEDPGAVLYGKHSQLPGDEPKQG